jgi:hypothetical protein
MVNTPARQRESRIDRLPRRHRRLIAVAALAGLPAMYAWSAYWLTTSVPKLVWGPVSFLLIALTAGGSLVLYRFVRDRADLRADLDERQRQLRDRAMVLAYQVLSGAVILVVAALAVMVLVLGRPVTLDGVVVGALAVSTGVLIPLLPIAALAWVEPDAPPED